jgi:hypothetical protein
VRSVSREDRSVRSSAPGAARGTLRGSTGDPSHVHLRQGRRISQYAVVETLNVEDSGRYAPGGGSTYCNIYAHDVAHALGA